MTKIRFKACAKRFLRKLLNKANSFRRIVRRNFIKLIPKVLAS